ncbi:MAG: peptide chain release factor N(5)-glutamine methyltransferase [Bacteroidota bacterium]
MRIPSNRIKDIADFFRSELKGLYGEGEVESFISIAMSEYLGLSRAEMMLRPEARVSESELLKFSFCVKDLKRQRPMQYIIGHTSFYGCRINVNELVLIPRPETEELVGLIVKDAEVSGKAPRAVLDIGTGSGCIAIALKRVFAGAEVAASDISPGALELARANAAINRTRVTFMEHDILGGEPLAGTYDIIVSNPPYVRLSEKESMSPNVREHEPHIALFVPDDDALRYFKAIAARAVELLNPGGRLYFEINEGLGAEVKKLLEEKGFVQAEVIKDLSGKDRMVRAAASA